VGSGEGNGAGFVVHPQAADGLNFKFVGLNLFSAQPVELFQQTIAISRLIFGSFFGGVMAGLADEEDVFGHYLIVYRQDI